MDEKDKEYIDRKFSELAGQMLSPDPEEALARAKVFRNYIFKKYAKWYILALVVPIITMIVMFRLLRLF